MSGMVRTVRSRWAAVATAAVVGSGLVVGGSAGAAPAPAVAAEVTTTAYDRLVPQPVSAEATAAPEYRLLKTARIVAPGEAKATGALLAEALRPATGFALPVVGGTPRPGDIELRLGAGLAPSGHAAEGYSIDVTRNVVIGADEPAGLFLGIQTLRQLFPVWVEGGRPVDPGPMGWTVPAGSVSDYPRFAYRAAMLDIARSFLSVREVKDYLDTMVALKANTLHLHLTDDQAWRIAIKQPRNNPSGIDYSQLIEVGSDGAAEVFSGSGEPLGTEPGIRGWWSQDDYRAVVRYAAERHVTIIPEVDGPGHTNAALASIPQLNPDGQTVPMNNTADVGYSTLDANSEVTYEFLRTVFGQLDALTPGPYLHIGGDEAHVTGHENYLTYMRGAIEVAQELGKLPMGWSEYAEVDLPEGSLVQYWTGALDSVVEQAERGAKVVMSPAATTYVDMKPFPESPIGLSWACSEDCDWDTYYDWEPVPDPLTEDQVAGVEAPLWAETVRGLDQARWLALPRLASVLEVGWTQESLRDVDDFGARLASLGSRWTASDTNFYASPGVGWTPEVLGAPRQVRAGQPLTGAVGTALVPGAAAGDVEVTVDFGDRSEPLSGKAIQPAPQTELSVGGPMRLRAPSHTYAVPGTYTGTVTVTVGDREASAPFVVTVS